LVFFFIIINKYQIKGQIEGITEKKKKKKTQNFKKKKKKKKIKKKKKKNKPTIFKG